MKPLQGIRVLDMTQFLAGPFCTMTLFDLGAEVLKIERPPVGDSTRTDPPNRNGSSAMHASINRGKKSLLLDLKNDVHKQLFLELAKQSDVIVENFKPGTTEKLGVGYQDICKVKPDIIYLSISGYGETGPYHERGALDISIQAVSGFMSITGERGGQPIKAGPSVADLTAGMYGVISVLAALNYRDKTGEGQHIDLAMLDCMVSSIMLNTFARYDMSGILPKPEGNRHPASSPFQQFATQDGNIIICCPTDRQFKSLCEGLGVPEMSEKPEYKVDTIRYAHKDELEVELQAVLGQWKTDDIASMMQKRGLAFGEVNNVEQAMKNPQILARDLYLKVQDDCAGEFWGARFPVSLKGVGEERLIHNAQLGEDSHAVFRQLLGMNDVQIQEILGGPKA